jgi:hypothetical protein
MDPHDTRRQCVPSGLDGPGSRPGPSGRKAGSCRERQRWAGTWFSDQSPRDRAPVLESVTCAALSASGSRSFVPANQASTASSPDRICQSGPRRPGLLASGHAASNIASSAPYPVGGHASTAPEPRDGSWGRSGGLGVPGSHFLAGLSASPLLFPCVPLPWWPSSTCPPQPQESVPLHAMADSEGQGGLPVPSPSRQILGHVGRSAGSWWPDHQQIVVVRRGADHHQDVAGVAPSPRGASRQRVFRVCSTGVAPKPTPTTRATQKPALTHFYVVLSTACLLDSATMQTVHGAAVARMRLVPIAYRIPIQQQ